MMPGQWQYPGGHGHPVPPQYRPADADRPGHNIAIWSLVFGIGSVLIWWLGLSALEIIVFGIRAYRQARAAGAPSRGLVAAGRAFFCGLPGFSVSGWVSLL